jgi:hypothetical protein
MPDSVFYRLFEREGVRRRDWRSQWDPGTDVVTYYDIGTRYVICVRHRSVAEGGTVPEGQCYRGSDGTLL